MSLLRRGIPAAAGCAALAAAGAHLMLAPVAQADTKPPAGVPPTVTADLLPTPQINGVVWDQEVVGSTVYVGGNFTSTRPFGAKAGSGESARTHLMSYDLNTGKATSWAPKLNGEVRVITASPDGKTIYVGGKFTQIDGASAYRIAAFDAATGQRVGSFRPSLDYYVQAIAVRGDSVYVGGRFSKASGQDRANLAAFKASNGAVLPWNPSAAGGAVRGLVVAPDGSKVVAVGQFASIGGKRALGWGAIDPTSGAKMSWRGNDWLTASSENTGIYSVSADDRNVYVTAFSFGVDNFEGLAAARWSDGSMEWVADCFGDTYDIAPSGPVVYYVGHTHHCEHLPGGKPETEPRTYMRANALSAMRSQVGEVNIAGEFRGKPAPDFLHWYPRIDAGTFTGTKQGSWTVETSDNFTLIGGEFPSVNGVAQQGLARFGVPGKSVNAEGPRTGAKTLGVTFNDTGSAVKATLQAAWDRDNERLTYTLYKGAEEVASQTVSSVFYNRPDIAFDPVVYGEGKHQFIVRVSDEMGNVRESKVFEVGSGELVSPVKPLPQTPAPEDPAPDQPGDPAQPVEPEQPGQPEQPAEPEQPGPVEPDEPGNSVEPEQPGDPAQPTPGNPVVEPEQPVNKPDSWWDRLTNQWTSWWNNLWDRPLFGPGGFFF